MFLRFMGIGNSDTTQTFYLELTGEVIHGLLVAMTATDKPPGGNIDVSFRRDVVSRKHSFFRTEPAPGGSLRGSAIIHEIPATAVPTGNLHLMIKRAFGRIEGIDIVPDPSEAVTVGQARFSFVCSGMLLAADKADLKAVLERYARDACLDCLNTLENGVRIRDEADMETLIPVLGRVKPADLACLLQDRARGIRVRARLLIGRLAASAQIERRDLGRNL